MGLSSCEVLQGPVLGPVLFIKYISELDYAVDAIVKNFADHTILYEWVRTGEQVLSMQNSLESTLHAFNMAENVISTV